MCEAIKYLHSNRISHLDVKLENFFITELIEKKPSIILADFGLSVVWDDCETEYHIIQNSKSVPLVNLYRGSCFYISPEILLEELLYPISSPDIWSLGICLYILLFQKYPFFDEDDDKVYEKIIKGEYIIPNKISKETKEYIEKILVADPFLRPTIFNIS